MTAWTSDELNKIGKAEELQIASLRADGTLRKPVIIWVVRLGDDLYVRSVNGRTSGWFRGVQTRHEGHIRRAAWRKMSPLWKRLIPRSTTDRRRLPAKYRRYPHIRINSSTRGATIKLCRAKLR